MSALFRKVLIFSVLSVLSGAVLGQRNYAQHSVLSSGTWAKIAVSAPGVYKIDVPLLGRLGISGTLSSSGLRIFGNVGAMLDEKPGGHYIDDLREIAIAVSDGGDGLLNGNDFVLFFAGGPHHWVADPAARSFHHKKNLFSDKSFYFIQVGGTGKRVADQVSPPVPVTSVTTFDERFFHELDTVNFLSSGKEWYGEELASLPGRSQNRSFLLSIPDLLPGPVSITSSVAARSVNSGSRFSISVNSQPVRQIDLQPVGTGIYDLFAREARQADMIAVSAPPSVINFSFTPGGFNSQGWINWFEFSGRRSLALPASGQLLFRDWASTGSGPAGFTIANAGNAQVWDITDPAAPVRMKTTASGNNLLFSNDAGVLREYICFSTDFLSPEPIGRVPLQDLHATTETDYIIITYPDFRSQALRLAALHTRLNNLRTTVVTTEQVYNEFGSGAPDPTAIRNFLKMYYDRYRSSWSSSGKYVLLLGKASFDYKDRVRNNTSFVPSFESAASLDPLATYTSDDYFGFLDDNEDISSGLVVNQLDIGIGRVPARSAEEAKNFVDKIERYLSPASFGPWRNHLSFVADDEDANLHLQDAETLSATVSATEPALNQTKIYLDAFRQEGGSGGGRYPQANAAINSTIYNGLLIWNYSGHGGPLRLAEETVLDESIIANWNNKDRLPLFITATCDFAPYDNPVVRSLGENLLLRPQTGAIALMTTTRVVFANSNRIMNNNYLRFALERDAARRYKTLGEAVRMAKNHTYATSGDIINNRKFVLLGDPALTLGFPQEKVRVTEINGRVLSAGADTLSAAEMVTLKGEVTDASGNIIPQFTGSVHLTVFDKEQQTTTRGNDPASQPVAYSDQTNFLFRGKASVQGGKFELQFRVPKDINYQYGSGKISLYAHDGSRDGSGFSNEVIIGGISNAVVTDNEGPEIKAYLNDDRFVSGSITNPAPVLLVKLQDSSGINTGGSGIDHDIVATLDGDNRTYYVLNNFYESDLDDYRKGTVRFQLPELSPGPHSLKIKAWDVLNHSNESVLDFTVVSVEELKLEHVLNYPNPFTTRTGFWFNHNRPGTPLNVTISIYTVSGKLIKTLTRTINGDGNRSSEIEWDGRDEFGARPGRGVYIYHVGVRDDNGKKAGKWERLVLLK
jgi:hypothetical protein